MDYIEYILKKIKTAYGMYIGNKSLHSLASFMSGFECAIYELTGKRHNFNSKFQRFIEDKYKIDFCTEHWADIISRNLSSAEAFDLFFIYWDEFNEHGDFEVDSEEKK